VVAVGGGLRLAFECGFFIAVDQIKELFDRAHAGAGPVTVPLQVRSHPVNFPLTAMLDVGGLREAKRRVFARIVPTWPCLQQFDALAGDPKVPTKLGPDVWSRPARGAKLFE